MPRFLHTWTGKFEWHSDATTVCYAILSHTWQSPEDGGEQTYPELLKIQVEVAEHSQGSVAAGSYLPPASENDGASTATFNSSVTSREPSPFFSYPGLSQKITMACKVAREAGYELLWIDTCCIDKTSSAEIAEVVNSMYEWYRLSDVCYAYLSDVPNGEDPREQCSRFRRSRWHTRGWTLQELIAAQRVNFLTETWNVLGTKMELATVVEKITGVDLDILVGHARVDSISVARRMSWAALRQTSRVEDRAYCLLGLFGVRMAPIYGEGTNAFLRLQEEILRTVPDQTLFAWECRAAVSGLLSTNPYFFHHSANVRIIRPAAFASLLKMRAEDVPPLHTVVTPQSVRIQLLCVDLDMFPNITDSVVPRLPNKVAPAPEDNCLWQRLPRPHLLALLQCQTHHSGLLALPLSHPPQESGDKGLYVGTHGLCADHGLSRGYVHMVHIPETVLGHILERQLPSVVEVSILRHEWPPSNRQFPGKSLDFWPKVGENAVKFEFSPRSIRALGLLGFQLSPLQSARSSKWTVVSFVLSSGPTCRPWTADLPRQRIVVKISFIPDGLYVVDAVFTVTNFTFGPPPDSCLPTSPKSEIDSTRGSPRFYLPPSFILDTTSGTYLTEGTSTSRFHNFVHTPYVLARAVFAIYAGPLEEDTTEGVRIRWLKILLQRSGEHPGDRLCIAVELSDASLYIRPSNCTASASSEEASPRRTLKSLLARMRNRHRNPA
ncbi:hypothetical protein BC628DRAFT_1418150 [Trametes gibbosa]|nr:hypothetical protein BC628DRAFT_1418150 [Trametes gibbosa]